MRRRIALNVIIYYTKQLRVREARDKEAFSLAATLPRSLTPVLHLCNLQDYNSVSRLSTSIAVISILDQLLPMFTVPTVQAPLHLRTHISLLE